MSDACEDYQGSCGRCYEIKCNPSTFKDGYGDTLDREQVCKDPDASLVVQITDSCPCHYPTNAFSNRRWCCGDMYHLDISTYAFEKLADKKWGVIGLKVRRVSCLTRPWRQALPPSNPTPPETRITRPWGWWDRRPWN